VLSHSVVVEPDQLGQLGDTHRSLGLGDVTEEPVARRVAEGAGFLLDPVRHRTAHLIASDPVVAAPTFL